MLGALADVEDALGHGDVALDLDGAALRYKYLANDADGIAASHHNYGSHTARYRGQVVTGQAHILAAALIRMLTELTGWNSRCARPRCWRPSFRRAPHRPETPASYVRSSTRCPEWTSARSWRDWNRTASRLDEAYRQVLTQVRG